MGSGFRVSCGLFEYSKSRRPSLLSEKWEPPESVSSFWERFFKLPPLSLFVWNPTERPQKETKVVEDLGGA